MISIDQNIIDKVVRGEDLSEEEMVIYLKVKDSTEFKKEIAEMEALTPLLRSQSRALFLNNLQKQEQKIRANEAVKKVILGLLLVGLIVSGYYYFKPLKDQKLKQQIYATHFTPYPNVINPITKGSTSERSVYQIYETENYHKVISLLETKKNLSDNEKFYLGQSYLSEAKYLAADKIFSSIKSATYKDKVNWYRALICLKMTEMDCLPLFKQISASENNYSKEASLIFEKLD